MLYKELAYHFGGSHCEALRLPAFLNSLWKQTLCLHNSYSFSMDPILPFVNIAFAFSAIFVTRRLLQSHDTIPTAELPVSQPNLSSKLGKIVKSCVICGSEEKKDELLLLKAPCDRHFVCTDDLASFFEHAINNESLFPPRCCNAVFLLQDYEHHVPAAVASAYLTKAQGEYAIHAKYRIYCANPSCAQFLHPALHVDDATKQVTYAVCSAASCGKRTCVRCKTLLDDNDTALQHRCGLLDEEDAKFQQTVVEKGYQACFVCGATVELTEACNHITCHCGASFCYICGTPWTGPHSCPVYGPPLYDAQGYNQDGYHRSTGLDRAGLTRSQRVYRREAVEWLRQRYHTTQREQHQQQQQPPLLGEEEPSGSRVALVLCFAFLMPRTSLVLRVGIVLGVMLVPPLEHWLPGLGHEYDRWGEEEEEEEV